jgi:hypothetical protein
VLVLKRLDFSRVASMEMARELQLVAGESYHTVESLQQNHQKEKSWARFKSKTMGELTNQKMRNP